MYASSTPLGKADAIVLGPLAESSLPVFISQGWTKSDGIPHWISR
jgi:hypothetical protein